MNALLLDLALKSVVVAVLGLGLTLLMRRSSSAARHLVLLLTLGGLLALPVLLVVVPRWQVPFLQVSVPAAAPAIQTRDAVIEAPTASVQATSHASAFTFWSVVAALILFRVGVKVIRLRRMERGLAMAENPALQALVAHQCRKSQRHVLLLEGGPHEPPMTWGHFRPVLLLPKDASEWQDERLNAVILHELAHIERGDWLSSLLAQVACGIYWFNPFVWAVAVRMSRESESAADDRVLGLGVSGAQYASHLLEVLRDLRPGEAARDIALAMARPGALDGRVRAILEERRCRRPLRGSAALATVAALGSAFALIAAAGPTLIRQAVQLGPRINSESERRSNPDANPGRQPIVEVNVEPQPKAEAKQPVILPANRVGRKVSSTQDTGIPTAPVLNAPVPPVSGDAEPVDPDVLKDKVERVIEDNQQKKEEAEANAQWQDEVRRSLIQAKMALENSDREAQTQIDKAARENGVDLNVAKMAAKFGIDSAQMGLKTGIKGVTDAIFKVDKPKNKAAPADHKKRT